MTLIDLLATRHAEEVLPPGSMEGQIIGTWSAPASLEAAMSADRHAAVSLHLPKNQGPMMPGTVERQDALPR